jgi:hypothetical protein
MILTPDNLDEVLYYLGGDGYPLYGKGAEQVSHHVPALA